MRSSRAARLAVAAIGSALLAGCRAPAPAQAPDYHPDRRDYRAFAEGHAGVVLEPNYLPFMVHPVPASEGEGWWLVLCRWEEDDMPLPVHVARAEIPEELQDEFSPVDPAAYAEAVEAALDRWEKGLEGLVRFRVVDEPAAAVLRLRLVAEPAPAPGPDVQVLGRTSLGRACRAGRFDSGDDRLSVAFAVPELSIYVADQHGLLAPDQVEWIALHEIGHALGMRGHSPIPADLMYEVVRDRVTVRELSPQDVNSFVSLYRLPNGTVFGRVPVEGSAPPAPPAPPTGPPQLELAPHVDPRLGFSWRPPAGWMRVETARGVVAVDGVTWDYTASFQVIVERYPTVEAYLERYADHFFGRGPVLAQGRTTVSGRPALQVEVADAGGAFADHLTFVESGDGRVVVVVADCPAALCERYRPWFDASLATLRIWDAEAR